MYTKYAPASTLPIVHHLERPCRPVRTPPPSRRREAVGGIGGEPQSVRVIQEHIPIQGSRVFGGS